MLNKKEKKGVKPELKKVKSELFKYPEYADLAQEVVDFIKNRHDVDITKKGRKEKVIQLRAMYYKVLLDHAKGESLETIGESIGFDHATVLNAKKKFDTYFKKNRRLYSDYIEICESLILKEDTVKQVLNSEEEKIANDFHKKYLLELQKLYRIIDQKDSMIETLVTKNMQLNEELKKETIRANKNSVSDIEQNPLVKQLRNELKESKKREKSTLKEYNDVWNNFKKLKGIDGTVQKRN